MKRRSKLNMCVICALWEKDKLTIKEADKAFLELIDQNPSDEFLYHANESISRMLEEDKATD